MDIKGLGHLAFVCKDLEASAAFYERALGLKQKFRIYYGDWLEHRIKAGERLDDRERARLDEWRGKPWIIYMALNGGAFIELFDAGEATLGAVPDGARLSYQHFALVVDDIFKARDELIKCGAPIDSPPSLGLEGTWQMWTRDPDGNKIECMQYTPGSWQLTGRP